MNFENLKGKVAVITGAASGQGYAVAQRLSERGVVVAAIDQNKHGLEQLESEIQSCGMNCLTIEADISNIEMMREAFDSVEKNCGQVDILAAVAAIYPNPVAVEEIHLEDVRRVMDVNILGSFYCATLAAGQMIQKKCGGRIIFWSSIGARLSLLGHSAYCATKGAIESMTRSFAQDLGKYGILVNAIAPGAIDTPMIDADNRDLELSVLPAGRVGTPDEIADLALFLCSDHSGFMTGSILSVDGGGTAINGSVALAQKIRQSKADDSLK